MDIIYNGERLWAGELGNIFVLLAFVSAIVSALSYFKATANHAIEVNSWKRIARYSFILHAIAVIGIISVLFYMLMNHYYEYHYVWQHSSNQMPLKYILSCFWEGQEGSFLLWIFWHVVIGVLLMRFSRNWEAPVMSVVASVQFFLTSMLLGVYVLEYRIGSNPFTQLLREHPDFAGIPLFSNPDYILKLDGRGLNPLLQNYWMTIHPPTLFLGFALTLVPFSYAIAALWTGRFNDWQKPALPWALAGIMVLGLGILMGGAWAYEALSFGGFWAWDPVENASLVPWLTLVGGTHVMMINKSKGVSLFTSLLLIKFTFILVLYSTFLTRSGILGEASVHAFTDLGMSGQLLIYLFFYIVLSVLMMMFSWKKIPKDEKEDAFFSREFWMFIGALVLFLSSLQIIYTTSIPVINKVLGTNYANPVNPVQHYNKFQVPFAIVITLLMGAVQFLKYKSTDVSTFFKNILRSLLLSVLITAILAYLFVFDNILLLLLLFTSFFAFLANADYLFRILNGRVKSAGASIAHAGFALVMAGALISMYKQDVISQNTSGKDVTSIDKGFSNDKNILLTRNDTLAMGDYHVVYKGKRKEGVNVFFDVDYIKSSAMGSFVKDFTLSPRVQMNPRMGNVAEPDTRHFLFRDVYTFVAFADLETINEIELNNNNEYLSPKNNLISVGDTIYSSNCILVLDSLLIDLDKSKRESQENEIKVGASFTVFDANMARHSMVPIYTIVHNKIVPEDVENAELGIKLSFWKIDPDNNKIEVALFEKKQNKKDFIVMKAVVFPFINLLWAGCVIMVIGTFLAIYYRIKKY